MAAGPLSTLSRHLKGLLTATWLRLREPQPGAAFEPFSEPDREVRLEGVVLGVLGELSRIGDAERGAFADG